MSRATISGIEVKIYKYYIVDGFMICDVKYPHIDRLLPVLAELIDVERRTRNEYNNLGCSCK